ncbi:hypothetical protein [Alicyclobacillus fodiniaquatilis]|jgi:hypothetical protein|uniref:DUF3592 domain-containing protein n=1 Tax=Alicyclobacillus fodiniaquatilis TaxID=1661150 RepID=A0ABW4JF60_9BACL
MLTVLGIVAAALLVYFVGKSMISQRLEKVDESTPEGVPQAGARWLVKNGYEVLQAENEAKYIGYVDAASIAYREKAHFIARKDGHEYAVFVGLDCPSREEICQRYFPLFVILGVHGLIFLNLTDESVHHVDFTVFRSRRYHVRHMFYRGLWFAGGMLFTFACIHRM